MSCSQADKADVIWENYIKTLGDRAQIIKTKSCLGEYSVVTSNGNAEVSLYVKHPDKVFEKTVLSDSLTITKVYNAGKAILRYNDENIDVPEKEINYLKTIGFILPDFYSKELGYEIDYIGEEIVNGIDCYKLEVKSLMTDFVYYIDKDEYHLVRMYDGTSNIEPVETEMQNGINNATKLINYVGADTMFLECKHHYNISIADSLFSIDY